MAKSVEERDLVRALSRGLDVILAFSKHRPRMTLSEVADATGLSKPTVRRLLLTLMDRGYVNIVGRTFALTPRVLALGYAYLSSLNLTEIAQLFMEHVVEETGASCALTTLDETDVVYLTRLSTHRITGLTLSTGTRLPAHATSLGHVLLADLGPGELDRYLTKADLAAFTERTITSREALLSRLEEVRRQGWAIADQELEDGRRAVSAPVRDAGGRVVAAMGLSAPTTIGIARMREEMLPPLLVAARGTSEQLGADFAPGSS
jgi:IclR family pca regulon transcriptional regulator